MGLRKQLFFPLLLLLLLPLMGWQVARQVEQNLRQSEEQALLAVTDSLARILEREPGLSLKDVGRDGLYVNPVHYPIQTDGFDDDWELWRDDAQVFESANGLLRVSVLLASYNRRLYGMVWVRDSSGRRAALDGQNYRSGDHLLLSLEDKRGWRRYRLMPSVPGFVTVMPVTSNEEAGVEPGIRGAWREAADGAGYMVEFSLPLALATDQLGLLAIDTGDQVAVPETARAGTLNARGDQLVMEDLIYPPSQLGDTLQRLLPPSSRGWVVSRTGWVMASAGNLNLQGNEERHWLRSLIYRALAGAALSITGQRDPLQDIRLTGSEINDALSGNSSVSWHAARAEYAVIASVAAPLKQQSMTLGAVVIEQPRDGLLLATNRTFSRTVLVSLAVFALTGLMLFAFASWMSWRIRRLRDATERAIAEEQMTFHFPSTHSKDEIGDLSRSFARLLGEVTEYNQYLKALGGRLSHELNTPLAIVRSSLENLAVEELSADAQAYRERAQQGVDRLQAILRAMSEAHRLEQAVNQFEPEVFDLGEVVSGCFDAYRQMSPVFNWQLDVSSEGMKMSGSAELIAQMLDKLVDNARSFTPENGLIKLTLSRQRRRLHLAVENDGPLLPDQLSGRLFGSLVSVRQPSAAQSTHLGVGLHIVRLIVKAHYGRVMARNRPDGSGVCFEMNFPVLKG